MSSKPVRYDDFRADLEGSISSVIQKIVGNGFYDWDEDYITRQLLVEYRQRFRNVQIKTAQKTIRLESDAYKLTGRLSAEQNFGDIALVVRIQYPDKVIEGVAFLEAKKIEQKRRIFGAIKKKQLERIYQNAPHAHLLLYDHENINQDSEYKSERLRGINDKGSLHAVALPVNLALDSDLNNTKLYRFSHPFSHQILTRYFRGLDLEFSREALDIAKGYNREIGAPKFLLIVSMISVVVEDGESDIPLKQSNFRGRNDNVFEDLEN